MKDIRSGSSSSQINELIVFNNLLYFRANDMSSANFEIWTSDGTESGTTMLMDLNPNGSGIQQTSDSPALTQVGNHLYFAGETNSSIGFELYKTDGTAAGTQLVKDINTNTFTSGDSTPSGFFDFNGIAVFRASNGTERDVYISDGTDSGTMMLRPQNNIANVNQSNFYTFNNEIFFTATYDATGSEIWKISNSTLSIEEFDEQLLSFYPNPVRDQLFLEFKNSENRSLEVYDINGKMVLRHQLSAFSEQIDLTSLRHGMYLITFIEEVNGTKTTFKIMKQ